MTSIQEDGSVEFRFYRAEATEVFIAGDFTQWQSGRIPMQRDSDGWWVLRMTLASGEHRFRYLADGQWYTDFASHGVELSKKIWNSVLLVPGDEAEEAVSANERLAA